MKSAEIDKFGILIPHEKYKYSRTNTTPNKHVFKDFYPGGCRITVSSKVVKNYNDFGKIEVDNILYFPFAIKAATGIEISLETLLNSQLYWLDVKVDAHNQTSLNNQEVLSVLREIAYSKTMKIEVLTYGKDKGFENSVLIKSSAKSVKDSLEIYLKIPEIYAKRFDYPDYFSNFSKDFFNENTDIIRFERRLQCSKAIKKAFHMKNKSKVTLNDIFESNCNVVAERIRELFLI